MYFIVSLDILALVSVACSQQVLLAKFSGNVSILKPLSPKTKYIPDVAMMHMDSGNTGSTDLVGPTGRNLVISTYATHVAPLLFDEEGGITAGARATTGDYILNAIDPVTLETLSSFVVPEGQVLNLAYVQMTLPQNEILVSSKQNHIFLIQRKNTISPPSFTLLRDIDVSSYLQPEETILNAMYDSECNIWFTTGLILQVDLTPQNSTTIGYITPSSLVHTLRIPNQVVENGIAVSGQTVFVVTGPPAADNYNSMGYISAFKASKRGGMETIWKEKYDAGSKVFPGGFARGSGTTPILLGDGYVAITDHADSQIHLRIFHQRAKSNLREKQLLCSVPIFEKGESACDIAAIGHKGEDGYAVFLLNDWNVPPIYLSASAPAADINGVWNNHTVMAAGGIRIDIPLRGNDCKIKWEKDIRMKSVPILSTATGLLYGYEQDERLAGEGKWVWYVTAREWETGREVWRVRAGAGGVFNDDFMGNAVGKDGKLYQGVVGGFVVVEDGRK
ncbi:hypothetical protein BGZ60DRAFT_473181 [Tricladium varicosporioides]|nr:hypothetical protein BGZ60DRAFT_473181 [Hymenoscyphus varicosporioides]